MNINNIDEHTKLRMFEIYWDEIDKWGRQNKQSTVGFSYEIFLDNTPKHIVEEYHRMAVVSLRKQKLDKLWKKTHS